MMMGQEASRAPRRRAIIVDDSRAMRSILKRALEEQGFQVVEAGHGKEALLRLAQIRIPDLALVDWNMPEMNGIELLTALRRDHNYDRMMVVMVTSETDPAQVERALTAGANEYIMKPFSNDVLEQKLTMLRLAGESP
jgi:two-component system, chemotaxis family, chemotaxis protein CheY